jgi:type IV pilus assembly protein PilV
MIGAVGCVEQVTPFDPNNPVYRVSVAWQGLMATAIPSLDCGKASLGDNNMRRVISVNIQIGNLTTT